VNDPASEEKKPLVALVHDQSLLRLGMEAALSRWFRVCIFSSSEDALVFARSTRTLNVLITDLDLALSALGGCNIARDVRERFPAAPIFVFSNGDARDHRLVLLRSMAGVSILSKPFGAFFLVRKVKAALAGAAARP
jgi:DNA-binding response OmpR family regulator